MKYILGQKAEQRIRDFFFIPWLLSTADFFQGSGFAAATKEENHKRWAAPPLLRFSPFEIPFPYLPLGSLHVGRFYRISAFCPTLGGSVW